MKTLLIRLSGFTFLPLLALITPLLLLPIISKEVGSSGISSVMAGQAIGTFAATALMWGWNVDGPVAIARSTTSHSRGIIYAESMRTRLLLLGPILLVTLAITALVTVPGFRIDGMSMAVVTCLAGMSPAWFCIGLGNPRLLALFDTIPKFLGAGVSAILLVATRQLWVYPVVTVLILIATLTLFHIQHAPGTKWFPDGLGRTIGEIGRQKHTAGINIAGSAYASTPTPIATITAPPVISGGFSTADTLYRFGLFTVIALGNAFQSWTLEVSGPAAKARHRLAIVAHLILGVVGAAILTALGPWASSLIFAGQIQADRLTCFYFGLAFLFISLATPFTRNILIPSGRQSFVFAWTIVAAVAGVVLMVVSGIIGDVSSIALGMALSEAILCIAVFGRAVAQIQRNPTYSP